MNNCLNIIHLERRTDRYLLLQEELKTQNIYCRIWPGIDDVENPAKGIAQAHKQVVLFAKESDYDFICIGEDDIHFVAPGAYQYFLDNIPVDFDLYLGGITYGKIDYQNQVEDFAGSTLYIIHRRFYDTFLSVEEDIDIDRALAKQGLFLVCNPFVAIPHNGYSDNKKKYMDYSIYLENRFLYGK